MAIADILRLVVIAAGIFILILDFVSFSRRKMTESIGLGWAFFSFLLIVVGLIPMWSFHCSGKDGGCLIPIFVLIFFSIMGMFYLSQVISQLIRKNQELAMQVSLLNQENERILRELRDLTTKK